MTPVNLSRQAASERWDAWRAANDLACRHTRTCRDCTGGYVCPDAVALERAVWLAEPGLTLPYDEPAQEGDYTSAWLNLLTLTVVVLFSFAVGVLIGTGGMW